jgi:hypothetical protein
MNEDSLRLCVVCGKSMNFEGAFPLARPTQNTIQTMKSTTVHLFSCRCGRTDSNEVELSEEGASDPQIIILHRPPPADAKGRDPL